MQNYSFPNVWHMEVRLCSVRKPLETPGIIGMVFTMPGALQKPSETFQKSIEKQIQGLDQIYGGTPTCLSQTGGSCLRKFNVQMLVESRFRLGGKLCVALSLPLSLSLPLPLPFTLSPLSFYLLLNRFS